MTLSRKVRDKLRPDHVVVLGISDERGNANLL